jgi:hypothetical protein
MKCDSCNKEFMFLYFIGINNVCNKCVAKHTVFKEVKVSEDGLLRRAMRAFEIKSFDDLKQITYHQLDKLKMGAIKEKNIKTFKYKKNTNSAVKVDQGDFLDPQAELDLSYE